MPHTHNLSILYQFCHSFSLFLLGNADDDSRPSIDIGFQTKGSFWGLGMPVHMEPPTTATALAPAPSMGEHTHLAGITAESLYAQAARRSPEDGGWMRPEPADA